MSQDHLSNFSFIRIERESVEKINPGKVICNFTSAKAGKEKYDNFCSANF